MSFGDVSAQTALEISSFQRDGDFVKFKTNRPFVRKLRRGSREDFFGSKKGECFLTKEIQDVLVKKVKWKAGERKRTWGGQEQR